MSEADRSLHLEEDLELEKKQWMAERIGWVIMLLLAIAALLGLLGHGPLSRVTRQTADGGLRVGYHRFERASAPSDLKITASNVTSPGPVGIWINDAFVEVIDIQQITPEPQRVEAGPGRLTYYFHRQPDAVETSVRISYQANSPGMPELRVGVVGGGELQLGQLVYP